MTVQNSNAVRNAQANAWGTAIGASAKIKIWAAAGAVPANCAASNAGDTMLVEFDLVSSWAAGASNGTITLSNVPISATAVGTGTAAYYRMYAADGSTCHEQGIVATLAGDMTIDATSIAASQVVQITAFSKTWPGG